MSATFTVLACAALAGALAPGGTRRAQTRLLRLRTEMAVGPGPGSPDGPQPHPPARGRPAGQLLTWGAPAVSALSCAVFLGGPVGLMAGVAAAMICGRVMARRESREDRLRRARLTKDMPVAVELLAACLRGGASWLDSVETVADALGGPVATEFLAVAGRMRLGADPESAWLARTSEPALAPLARAVARAADSGAALATTLDRLAADHRRAARAAASARAQAAGVRAVAPLGLCFLPAFVLLGIVPAVAGVASRGVLP